MLINMLRFSHLIWILLGLYLAAPAQQEKPGIITGAEQPDIYIPILKELNVAVVANHTSLIGNTNLVDSLIGAGLKIVKVFSPEHGFRGRADAGQKVDNKIDLVTGLSIISLYGDHKKPQPADLNDVDIVIFDLQDVGARFYTYISTMTYVMEACAENNIPVVVLDRPNPNGFYVDGPVLEPEYKSFVGLHPVPVVHGMTTGEYALMVNGEYWLADSLQCDLTVVPVKNYSHTDFYELPVKPSPNLPNKYAVYLYPSLCFFEGTVVSVGRGTDYPFQITGHPEFVPGSYIFTPRSIPGASTNPKHEGVYCNGQNLIGYAKEMQNNPAQINLTWLIAYHEFLKDKTDFFNNYFEKLAGTGKLRKQIEAGLPAQEIRESWQPGLIRFKEIRKKYLLYPDFEQK
jgi:uncharacterized protein YbbC (DUF1343 family)